MILVNLRYKLKFIFSFLTVSIIVQSLYYILFYLGQVLVFSSEHVEGFRTDGKPFLLFMLSFLQLMTVGYLIPKDLKEFKRENRFGYTNDKITELMKRNRISLELGSYYNMKLGLYDGGWSGFKKSSLKFHSNGLRFLGVDAKTIIENQSIDVALNKIKLQYYRITFLMFFFPLVNLLINLLYIFEYSLNLSIPKLYHNYIQFVVEFFEGLWQNPLLGIILSLIEIAVATTIYYRIFGNPFRKT